MAVIDLTGFDAPQYGRGREPRGADGYTDSEREHVRVRHHAAGAIATLRVLRDLAASQQPSANLSLVEADDLSEALDVLTDLLQASHDASE